MSEGIAEALRAAVAYLRRRERSESEVVFHLAEKGYLPLEIEPVLERLREKRIVDDRRLAGLIAETLAAKGSSRQAIEQALHARAIAGEAIELALAELPDEAESMERLLAQKFARDRDPARAWRHLVGKGFDAEEAQAAVARFFGTEG